MYTERNVRANLVNVPQFHQNSEQNNMFFIKTKQEQTMFQQYTGLDDI